MTRVTRVFLGAQVQQLCHQEASKFINHNKLYTIINLNDNFSAAVYVT